MKQITHLVFAGNALKSICICGVLRYIYCYKMDENQFFGLHHTENRKI